MRSSSPLGSEKGVISKGVRKRWIFERSIRIKETKATIKTSSMRFVDIGFASLLKNRKRLEHFLIQNKSFKEAMKPVDVSKDSPDIISRMSVAAKRFGVGPMASVAGALADLCLEEILLRGAEFGMVENGGEIAVNGMDRLLVSIFAGDSPLSNRLGLQLAGRDLPIGIGTSSATVGHAISLGEADAAVAICDNACLADAAATAIGNEVYGPDLHVSIDRALKKVSKFRDLRGTVIIRGAWIGTWGELPQLVKISRSFEKDDELLFSKMRRSTNTSITEFKSLE